MLHFTNAYEDGDEIVLDGFFEGDPEPVDSGTGDKWQQAFRFLALDRLQTRLHRWRFNLVTGAVQRGAVVRQSITEFGMINAGYAGQQLPLHLCRDRQAGLVPVRRAGQARPAHRRRGALRLRRRRLRQRDRDGARGVGSTAEDDGYLVTLTTDMNADASYCLVFDAARVADGPVCKLALPERISSGTHSRGRRARSCGAGGTPTPRPARSACRWPSRPRTPSRACSGLLGDEWTLLIIQQALLGATRYGEFMTRLPISNSVLTSRLQTLTDDGLLERRGIRTNPPRSEYVITPPRSLAVAGAGVDLGVGTPLGARTQRAPARHAPHRLRR